MESYFRGANYFRGYKCWGGGGANYYRSPVSGVISDGGGGEGGANYFRVPSFRGL